MSLIIAIKILAVILAIVSTVLAVTVIGLLRSIHTNLKNMDQVMIDNRGLVGLFTIVTTVVVILLFLLTTGL